MVRRASKQATKQDSVPSAEQCRQMGRTCASMILRRASRSVTRLYDRVLEPSSLSAAQLTMLASLRAAGPQSSTELARILDIDRSTLSRNLAVVEERGLVRVEPGEDRRTHSISLSRAGERALTLALPLWRQAQEVIEGLCRDQEQELERLMSTVRHLGADAADPGTAETVQGLKRASQVSGRRAAASLPADVGAC